MSAPNAIAHKTKPPTWRLVFSHPAYLLGLGFGSGLAPKAPGTVGTLAGWMLFSVMHTVLPPMAMGVVVLASIPVGWWACTKTAAALRQADPGCIVWDEIAAFWALLWALQLPIFSPEQPQSLLWRLAAFVLFRFFDAVKPWPVSWADRTFKGHGWRGGWGIMLDDLVAAACTLGVLAGLAHAAAQW